MKKYLLLPEFGKRKTACKPRRVMQAAADIGALAIMNPPESDLQNKKVSRKARKDAKKYITDKRLRNDTNPPE